MTGRKDAIKALLLGATGLIAGGMAAPALAADLPAGTYTKAPAMIAAIYDWSGFYFGLNGGGGSSHKCWSITNNLGVVGAPAPEGCHDATGGTAGGQVGYRWQANSWVFGVEGQGNWANLTGSNPSLFFGPGVANNQTRINGFGLLTGQAGYAWNTVLLYLKGGAAVVADRFTGVNPATGTAFDQATDTRWGGAVGTGVEFSFAANWSAAVEYDHMFMGTRADTFVSTGVNTPVGTLSRVDNIHQDVDMVTAHINYRWGGPVISKY
jgi:outer membrane immunogenic protein